MKIIKLTEFKITVSGKIAATLLCLITLSACGGNKTVVTQDDSAEYQNAVTLPPLKKPSKHQEATKPEIPVPTSNVSPASTTESSSDTISEQINIEHPPQEAPIRAANIKVDKTSPVLNAQVIDGGSDTARLSIDAKLDEAWAYISATLKGSDITVHNRNQTAGQFAIGCSDIDGVAKTTKRGGWSFFSRKPEATDHCVLQLTASRSATVVKVINRSGNEVSAAYAQDVFSRLLNN